MEGKGFIHTYWLTGPKALYTTMMEQYTSYILQAGETIASDVQEIMYDNINSITMLGYSEPRSEIKLFESQTDDSQSSVTNEQRSSPNVLNKTVSSLMATCPFSGIKLDKFI
ncbi:unnamed protein product [Didymodactylos carnosus]|nr:unnamed protein product [Didymodactylos carnosus]CAF4178544.1 unnamed protein product [Didymodactylos carnosus]